MVASEFWLHGFVGFYSIITWFGPVTWGRGPGEQMHLNEKSSIVKKEELLSFKKKKKFSFFFHFHKTKNSHLPCFFAALVLPSPFTKPWGHPCQQRKQIIQHEFLRTNVFKWKIDWIIQFLVRSFNWFCSLFEVSGGAMALTVAESLEQLMERGWREVHLYLIPFLKSI